MADFFNRRKGGMRMKAMIGFAGVQMKWAAVLAGMFCLSMSAGVCAAQDEKPCAADAARLCKGVQQGEGRVAHCLREHANELSRLQEEHRGNERKGSGLQGSVQR
jgi:hypothetical protein